MQSRIKQRHVLIEDGGQEQRVPGLTVVFLSGFRFLNHPNVAQRTLKENRRAFSDVQAEWEGFSSELELDNNGERQHVAARGSTDKGRANCGEDHRFQKGKGGHRTCRGKGERCRCRKKESQKKNRRQEKKQRQRRQTEEVVHRME